MNLHFFKKRASERKKQSSSVSSEISSKKAEIKELKRFMKELGEEDFLDRNARTAKYGLLIRSLKAEKEMGELKGDLHELKRGLREHRKRRVINFFRAFKPTKRVTKKAKEKYTY